MERLTELSLPQLRDFADTLSIGYASNISGSRLRAKIEEAVASHKAFDALEAYLVAIGVSKPTPVAEAVKAKPEAKKMVGSIAQIKARANALVRFKLVCNDPSKANIPGEYFCVGNRIVGNIKRYIPYSQEFYDGQGWHAERAILDMLKNKYCYVKRTYQPNKNVRVNTTKLEKIKMFTITELPQLTPEELSVLAKTQRESGKGED